MIKKEDLRNFILNSAKNKYPKEEIEDILKKKGLTLFLKGLNYNGTLVFKISKEIFKDIYDERQALFLILHSMGNPPLCQFCNVNPSCFINIQKGYSKFCSIKCASNSPEVNKKRVENYKTTCLKKYGVNNVFKRKEIKNKTKKTNLKKYGFENASQSKEVKDKIKKTNLDRFGFEYAAQSSEVREKMVETNRKKFGVDYYSQTEEYKEKVKKTNIERYGYESPANSKEVRDKYKKTCIERYGVDNVSKSPKIKKKIIDGVHKSFFNKLVNSNRLRNLISPLFDISEYLGVEKKYEWRCNKCGNIFQSHLNDGFIPRCYNCFPRKSFYSSNLQKEIFDFCKKYFKLVIQNDRSVLEGYELDIYIPEKNLAIEFNGIFWHSEIGGNKYKNYHLQKTLDCEKKGIQLIHIFEDEWIEKKDIVRSILRNKFGKTENIIYARKCEIDKVTNEAAKSFYFDNHLQGYYPGIHIGLFSNDKKLISLITFGIPRYNKNYQFEILRFCNKIHYSIVGGLSKLVSSFIENYQPNSILTYVDLRYGTGKSYLNCGFKNGERSGPNYYYLNDHYIRENRLKYQKHKLEEKLSIFDSTLTEWENMQLNGYDRIWDCGCDIYLWENQENRKELKC